MGSEGWVKATAQAFNVLKLEECAEAAKPEWWNDEGLKALSARVVRAAANEESAHAMRALVLSGVGGVAWGPGPRSAAELKEAATHFERAGALSNTPVLRAEKTRLAGLCRSQAEAM